MSTIRAKWWFSGLLTIFLLVSSPFVLAAQVRDSSVLHTKPAAIYSPTGEEVKLKIGNGGAGPTGLIKALSEAYLNTPPTKDFAIAWYRNISPGTLELLKRGIVDVAMVYEPHQVDKALKEGWATHPTLIFQDHFMIVGPKNNPAHLLSTDTPLQAFEKIRHMGQTLSQKSPQGLFFSRDDQSATNVKEQEFWQQLQIMPWKTNPAWYVKAHLSAQDGLLYADQHAQYTMTDRGTWLSNKKSVHHSVIYIQGGKTLNNHCYALLGKHPSALALDYLNFLTSPEAQALIAHFGKEIYGEVLYKPAAQAEFPGK